MSRKKRDEETETSKPFFARYLQGQDTGASSAKVREPRSSAYKKANPPLQTLKFPSDSDELHYYPYYPTKADVPKKPGGGIVTLKFPSDGDEDVYHASYISKADAPKGTVKAKGGKVTLKKARTIKAQR